MFDNSAIIPVPSEISLKATRQLRNNREHAQFEQNATPKMADKLVVLTILLLFVSFRPIISDGEANQEGKSLKHLFAASNFFGSRFFWKKAYFCSAAKPAHGVTCVSLKKSLDVYC